MHFSFKMIQTITLYRNTDIYGGVNDVERLGFDKNMTFGAILDLAILHRCPVIVKNGNGKWYLKGQCKTPEEIAQKIEQHKGQHVRVKCWVVEFSFEDDDDADKENQDPNL